MGYVKVRQGDFIVSLILNSQVSRHDWQQRDLNWGSGQSSSCRTFSQYLVLSRHSPVITETKQASHSISYHTRFHFSFVSWHSPLPQDTRLHRCQLGGRGFQAQWNSRAGFPLRRCTQVTWRDWNPWRPQVAVHWVQGPTRQCRAHASDVQLRCEAGLRTTRQIRTKPWLLALVHGYLVLRQQSQKGLLPRLSAAHLMCHPRAVLVLAEHVSVLKGLTWSNTVTLALMYKYKSVTIDKNSHFCSNKSQLLSKYVKLVSL